MIYYFGMPAKDGRGRKKSIEGITITRMFTMKRPLVTWLVSEAKRKKVVPSVIVNHALEMLRRDGSAA